MPWSVLIFEALDRCAFYGTRAVLVLYLAATVGFVEDPFGTYGAFCTLAFVLPVVGSFLGTRNEWHYGGVVFGTVMNVCGLLSLGLVDKSLIPWCLGMICVGNGLVAPNITKIFALRGTARGSKKDRAFSAFYMALNCGALMGPLICGILVESVNWRAGFFVSAACGLLILIGVVGAWWPWVKKDVVQNAKGSVIGLVVMGCIVPGSAVLIARPMFLPWVVAIIGVMGIGVMGIVGKGIGKTGWSIIGIVLVQIVFWIGLEQTFTSLTVLANSMVNRSIGGWELPAATLVALNPALVLALTPLEGGLRNARLLRVLYYPLARRCGVGFGLVAMGFAVVWRLVAVAGSGEKISLGLFVTSYVLITLGELLIVPSGLAELSRLSELEGSGIGIGYWYYSVAVGAMVGANVAKNIGFRDIGDVGPGIGLKFCSIAVVYLCIAVVLAILGSVPRGSATGGSVKKTV
jgi:POT family proton-dependent oligopeptide transporter